MEYINWFDGEKERFSSVLLNMSDRKIKALQIGAYTGDATIWLLDNVLKHGDSVLYDVDNWVGTDDYKEYNYNFSEIEEEYDKKTLGYSKLIKNKMTSDEFFAQNKEIFDFIYVDGHHHSEYVARDAENAMKASKPGTIIAFDDYGWKQMDTEEERPKLAIDGFLAKYADKLEVLIKEYQVWVKVL